MNFLVILAACVVSFIVGYILAVALDKYEIGHDDEEERK